ncbi:unnamed protein product, partial [Tetraodon nigroviridis]
YYEKVLLAAKRWFSFFGWSCGPHPISVPHTLRRVVSKTLVHIASGQSQRVTLNRDTRSVVNMLQHLTGQPIPGIPCCQTFSSDLAHRTRELLQQHEAVLTFLRVQGAFLCHVRPAFLLDVEEFKHWCSLQSNEEENGFDYSCVDYESLSKRCWTDVLLQIYKVLVLSRVSKSSVSSSLGIDGIPQFNPQSLASNIYSCMELQLLSWINTHYQSSRETLWRRDGGGPLARWIVNFDLDFKDGLVLAGLLAAYCPYLIHSHFQRMYMRASTTEQATHNNIIVCQALTTLNLNFDIQADCVGHFTCQVVLSSCFDTRVYEIEAVVTSQSSFYHRSTVHWASRWRRTYASFAHGLQTSIKLADHLHTLTIMLILPVTSCRYVFPPLCLRCAISLFFFILAVHVFSRMFIKDLSLCLCVRWTRQSIPLVNPTAERLELLVSNTNPRNYTVEMDSGNTTRTQLEPSVKSQQASRSSQFH